MFKEFFIQEVRRGLRQPMVYIFFFVIALLVFGAVASDNVIIGGSVGNVHKNAPYVVSFYTLVMTLLGLLIAAAFFNNAALRDHEYDFQQILFSTPINKFSFYFGRFTGAWLLATLPLLGVYLGVIIASWIAVPAGWLDAERLGAIPYDAFFKSYFIVVWPNMLFAGAVIFALAIRWKSTIISFTGALAIIVLYSIAGTLTSDLENETIGAMLDAFGLRTFSIETKYWTPAERNAMGIGFSGLVLINRAVWMITGIAVLALSFFTFSFKEKTKGKKKEQKEEVRPAQALSRPMIQQSFAGPSSWIQFRSFFLMALRSIIKNPTFKILLAFSFILYTVNLIEGFEAFGLKSYPVSYKMNDTIEGAAGLFIIIIIVFFSGELVWRDRLNHINEVVDATPHQSILSLLGKVLALVIAAVSIDTLMIVIGMGYQALNGYFRIEPLVYFGHVFIDRLPGYFFWSMFLIFLQVIINQRYVAYFVSILVIFLIDILWLITDVESLMVDPGGLPRLIYSDMNGFGDAMTSTAWFNLYWTLFALMMLFFASYMWSRGMVSRFAERWRLARQSLKSRVSMPFYITSVIWVFLVAWVFYNTQVLNTYQTSDELEELQVYYEQEFKQYKDLPMPKITDALYEIDIYPHERDVMITATTQMKNTSDVAIPEVHFSVDKNWNHEILIEGATMTFEDEKEMYRKYSLARPLQPGESIEIVIKASYITKGFENDVSNRSVASNGTFINNMSFMPSLGYSEQYELGDKNDRRSYGLPAKARMPKLQEDCDDDCMINYLSDGKSDWVNVETVISTSKDQVAVAPGSLVDQWEEDGRNYYRYNVDHPSLDFYSFISAEFEVARKKWNGIDIEVYYDEDHPENVNMMLDAVERSLAYYTENFGPYYHKQARIIEFPRYSSFAQAFPGTMPYSESIGFIADLRDEDDNNIVDAVVAHEMAHQWWAHQEMSAKMQGGTMLTESFAEYSSLMVMKQISDPMKMREFLKYDHDRYMRGRSRETDVERPLYKVENQSHIHYGKGSVILYALQDHIGEDSVNAAMRSFLQEWAYQGPPYPTSLDFLDHLEPRVPDSLHYLIDDWFKEITLYDNRIKEARYLQLEDGTYEVELDIYAQKVKSDTLGNETPQDPSDWIHIGLFGDADEKELIAERKVFVDKEEMTFTIRTDSMPVKAAIDPRRILIDRVYDDNVKSVSKAE